MVIFSPTLAEEDAVENLKTALTNLLILALPCKTGQHKVNTITCNSQKGCALLLNNETMLHGHLDTGHRHLPVPNRSSRVLTRNTRLLNWQFCYWDHIRN